jgi:tetratricopeptide (TPR) repeat protein
MKRLFLVAFATLATVGCAAVEDFRANRNPYENPFYVKYLNTGSQLDAEIQRALEALRQNPGAPEHHNTLGTLLMEKGFPKDAERELERAINADRRYYPAWYNLGLVRASRGDELGARRAFGRTVDLKPGHAAALFQLGLIEERRSHTDRAVALYAKAFGINPALLDVEVNPRILDSKLTHLALLKLYPTAHARESMQFAGSPVLRAPEPPKETPAPAPAKPPQ